MSSNSTHFDGVAGEAGDRASERLVAVRGHEAAFAEAASRYRVQLECVMRVDPETVSPELILPLDQLQALTQLGIAAIGLDIS